MTLPGKCFRPLPSRTVISPRASTTVDFRYLTSVPVQDVRRDLVFEHAERHGAVTQQHVVELPHVEPRPERGLRLRPQLADLQLAHLVAQGLAGPGDVAVHLGGDLA